MELTDELKELFTRPAKALSGSVWRIFMADVVEKMAEFQPWYDFGVSVKGSWPVPFGEWAFWLFLFLLKTIRQVLVPSCRCAYPRQKRRWRAVT